MRALNPFIVPLLLCSTLAATSSHATLMSWHKFLARLDTPNVVAATDHAPVRVTLIPGWDCERLTTRLIGEEGIVINSPEREQPSPQEVRSSRW